MKSFLVFSMLLATQVVFADSADMQIRSLARRINDSAYSSSRLTMDEKVLVIKALNNADSVLARVATDDRPGPGPGPRPVPNPYPYPTTQMCDRESAAVFQSTFVQIKNMAYASAGLNYDGAGATQFAEEWTRTHACSDAELYIRNITRVKNFAYATTGLNYDSAGAREFALQNVERICQGYNFEAEFSTNYNFAYSTAGMNMSGEDARNYAFNKIKNNAFTCNRRN